MEREGIKEIIQKKIERCDNILDLKKILFQASQERFGAKNTTGIRKEIKETITIKQLIELANKFSGVKEKIELIKIIEIQDLKYADVQQIFEGNDLLQVVKEFNINVNREILEELFNTVEGKNKDLVKELLNMNSTDEKTITELVLENIEDEKLIDFIREYNLRLNNEQLREIEMRFQNVEISVDNRQFLDTVLTLSKKNDELTRTINYQIIDERYRNLDKYLPILTCHPEQQEQIISLDEKELRVFTICLNDYSNKTQDWTTTALGMLQNISQYSRLLDSLEAIELQNEDKVQLLTKLLSEPNYFSIKNIDEYIEKRERICNLILNNPNSQKLEQFTLISQMSEEDRIRFAVLEKNYGLSLDQAESLIRKFGDDIKSISGLGENADYYRGLISSLKFICDEKNISQISQVLFESKGRALNANVIEREIKDIYDKDYVSQLYRPIEEDFEREEDGIKIYKAGKSTNGEFFIESHAPGAVYSDSMLKDDIPRYVDSWNKPLMLSQAFCTHLISNQMLYSNIRDVEYGFYNYEKGSLRAAGYNDISSDFTHFTAFADHDEKYSSIQQRINKTRANDESDRARLLPNGTKRQPDYIKLLTSRHIPKQLATQKLEHSKLAAQQFSKRTGKQIPIVMIDQDECTRQENEIIRNMIQEFRDTKNPELISNIITRFENNRAGNRLMYGSLKGESIDFSIDTPINTDEFGKAIITRNEMLSSMITTIRECKDASQAKALYEMLNKAISEEVSKLKKPGIKVLNDTGIPVVTKKAICLDDYFSTRRDRETGKYDYISSHREWIDLKESFELGQNYTEQQYVGAQEVGKGTIREAEQASEIDETMQILNAHLRNRENEQTKGENN